MYYFAFMPLPSPYKVSCVLRLFIFTYCILVPFSCDLSCIFASHQWCWFSPLAPATAPWVCYYSLPITQNGAGRSIKVDFSKFGWHCTVQWCALVGISLGELCQHNSGCNAYMQHNSILFFSIANTVPLASTIVSLLKVLSLHFIGTFQISKIIIVPCMQKLLNWYIVANLVYFRLLCWRIIYSYESKHDAPTAHVIDVVSGDAQIAELWSAKFENLHNHCNPNKRARVLEDVNMSVSDDDLVSFSIAS